MRQIATELIILKRINFGEADRILTVLTKDAGQMSMFAKGVRRAKSKLAGGLELFSVSEVNYIDGKSELKTIVSTRLKVHFKHIVADVDRTMAAYDYMKSVSSYSQHTDQSDYYDLLVSALEALDSKILAIPLVDTWFYVKLLQINGSNINLEKPLNSEKFTESDVYNFSFDDMSFFAHVAGVFRPNHIKFMRLVERSSNPKQLLTINDSNELASDLQNTVKQIVLMQ
jgi:DNA repair protein RecO (recombination protein O)